MKLFLIFLTVLLSMGCGHNRLQFAKVDKCEKNISIDPRPGSRLSEIEMRSNSSIEDPVQKITIESEDMFINCDYDAPSEKPEKIRMSIDDPKDKEHRKQEKLVIRHATISTEMFVAGSIATLFLTALVGLPLFFVGLNFYLKSKRAGAQTGESVDQLRRAKIAMIINLILLIVMTFLVLYFIGLIFI